MSLVEAAQPLHRQIYADIEGRILSGELKPGDRIPPEHELCGRYACARMTVNKAVSELAGRGLVIRRRRAGTFVAAPRAHSAVLAIPDLESEVRARGQAYDYRLLEREARRPDPRDSAEVALADGGELLALECLHGADGRPFSLERRLISLKAAPQAATADFRAVPPGGWLLRAEPWTGAEHRIMAMEADPVVAAHLAINEGAACLVVERRTWRSDDGREDGGREDVEVTHVWQIFPGAAYDLVARFAPGREDR